MALLDIRGLVKTYSNRRVVDGVDFYVDQGEIVGLLGPNGAGKTTTFRIVMGIIKSEGGNVSLMDEDITKLPMYKRARHGMGYLSQEPSIFRNMTVEDNVMSILETQNLTRAQRRERLAELLGDKWRYRIGEYRVVCDIQDEVIRVLVLAVGHRSDIYRRK